VTRDERLAYGKSYYRKNRTEMLERAKSRYDHEENHAYQINLRYGVTKEEYASLLKAQGEECAICENRTSNRRTKKLSIDHDHETKETRGLLCAKCNLIIGLCGENADILINAANYLAIWKEEGRIIKEVAA